MLSNRPHYTTFYPEKTHSGLSALMLTISILLLFLFQSFYLQLGVFTVSIAFAFFNGLRLHSFLKTLVFTVGFSAFYLLMKVLFPSQNSYFYQKLWSEIFTQSEFFNSREFLIFTRMVFVSTLSITSVFYIKIEVILLYLLSTGVSQPMILYPLLFAFNSITLLKKKYDLFLLSSKLRRRAGFLLPQVLFQFIVFILRFSESASLSLVSRGLSNSKSYYYDFKITPAQKISALIFAGVLIGVLGLILVLL